MKFDGGRIHVFPDGADYALKSASLGPQGLEVAYDTPQGAVSEVYAVEGASLRLDHGTYGDTQATWHKQPMNKCA